MKAAGISSAVMLCYAVLFATSPAWSQTQSAKSGHARVTTRPAATEHNFAKWEKSIAAFERKDAEKPPAKGGVLFIGSSTIVRWKTLEQDFPESHPINRGFGGSEIVDSTHFAERIVFPYEPRMIFLRAGGNDIAAGKTPDQVFEDYKAFVAKVHAKLPKTVIAYISVCPVPSHWSKRDRFKALNKLIEKHAAGRPYLKYIETYDIVLGPDGTIRPELIAVDKGHLSDEGYKLLVERVRPFMPK
jgi:hypothetical protein